MAYPTDQINNRVAFDKLIRDGIGSTIDSLLDVKNQTWIFRGLRDKLNVQLGSNPGTNTYLDGNTTMYRVVDEKSYATFREVGVNEETLNAFDGGDKRYQIEVPIKQGITRAQRTTFSEFMYDKQTGRQIKVMTPDLFIERLGAFTTKILEVEAKWIDKTILDSLFFSTYKTKIENNTDTAGDSTITLSYDELTNKISNISSYKFVYDIEETLILNETIKFSDRGQVLGIIPIHSKILAYFKKQFLDDANFNTMSATERNNYVSQYALDEYFMFPNSRILFMTLPRHLEASTLNSKATPTAFTVRMISREAINQINGLPNVLDDIQAYEGIMANFGVSASDMLEATYFKGGELNQTFCFGVRSGGDKLISNFFWLGGIRICVQPEQPKRACATFTLDNVAVFGDAQAVTSAIQSSVDAQTAIVLNRIVNV